MQQYGNIPRLHCLVKRKCQGTEREDATICVKMWVGEQKHYLLPIITTHNQQVPLLLGMKLGVWGKGKEEDFALYTF